MIKKILYSFFFILFNCLLVGNSNIRDYSQIINLTEEKYRSINDYEVDLEISVKIPAFRMPKKKYKVFFKQPNKVKLKTKGFGLLPKTGIFTSPLENFDNLKNMRIMAQNPNAKKDNIIIHGDLIVDSLALDMPNEYAKLTFKPTVEVSIDTNNWVITNVTTKIDTLKLIEINNKYELIKNTYFMPIESKVEYYVKDARLTKWINRDLNVVMGSEKNFEFNNDIVKGFIQVQYFNYRINKGIDDKIFKE
tara:strand:- start:155 stop:901 length:747 start_codon:yes stop_codon:yes gene_type:complete